MNQVRNYQKELEKIIQKLEKEGQLGKRLYLHSCCAPCSSYCLEYLRQYFQITVFYYNPNITFEDEYRLRVEEQKRLIAIYNEQARKNNENAINDKSIRKLYEIDYVEGDYDTNEFYSIARGLEQVPEGGERCFRCYDLRLREAAKRAKAGGYDYFSTTLTISPYKNAPKLNEIGEMLASEYGVEWLVSDFKKNNGYKRSIELSEEYGLYRQDYCGCVYSKLEMERLNEGK